MKIEKEHLIVPNDATRWHYLLKVSNQLLKWTFPVILKLALWVGAREKTDGIDKGYKLTAYDSHLFICCIPK